MISFCTGTTLSSSLQLHSLHPPLDYCNSTATESRMSLASMIGI